MKTKLLETAKTQEERVKLKELLFSNKIVLDILREICYNNIRECERTSLSDYDNPSWAYRRADRDGYIRALRDFAELLNLDPRESPDDFQATPKLHRRPGGRGKEV